MKTIEKERKWLLKNIPTYFYDKVLNIEQVYTEDGWRYRETTDQDEVSYVRLKKVSIGIGINHELDISDIDKAEFDSVYYNKGNRHIGKTRYVKNFNGKKIEIDQFHSLQLVVMEVEDVSMDEIVVFPEEIEKMILMEVTGNLKFNNSNLAE